MLTLSLVLMTLAQPPDTGGVRGDSPATRKRLVDAEQLITTNPTQARITLLKIVDDAGDDFVATGEGAYVPARRVAQTILAKLPAAEMQVLREAQEPIARKLLLAAGVDESRLHDVVNRYRLTPSAAASLERIGDLAFERGDFARAEATWRRLLPGTHVDEEPVAIPAADNPRILARIGLAVIRQRDRARAADLIKQLESTDRMATGWLAGEEGKFVDILKRHFEKPLPPASIPARGTDWSTLGGASGRTGHVPGSVIATPISPMWTAPLPADASATVTSINTTRLVAHHGVFYGRWLIVAQPRRVVAFDGERGAMSILHDAPGNFKFSDRRWHDADFSLTVTGNRVYARVGSAAVLPNDAERAGDTKLIALTADDADAAPKRLVWSVSPPVAGDIVAGWEGAPVVVGQHVFAAFSRRDGGRIVHAIVCYEGLAVEPLWVTDVAESSTAIDDRRERHLLLTPADSNIVLATHAGVIAAVNAATGKPAWAHRYPSIPATRLNNRHRDVSPPVARDGRVFIAPNDSDQLFAIDADTGRRLWTAGPSTVDHIVGVTPEHVIAAIAGPQRGVRGFNVRTGSADAPHGWSNHDDPALASFGRGLIVGDHLAWPTAYGMHFLLTSDGLPARQSLPGPQGNLAFADGRLAVIAPREVRFYRVPPTVAPPSTKPPAFVALPIPEGVRTRVPTTVVALTDAPRIVASELGKPTLKPDERRTVWKNEREAIISIDARHVARVNVKTGETLWIRDALLRPRFWPEAIPTAPRFDEAVFADDRVVIARNSQSLVVVIDATTGAVVNQHATAAQSWTAPPTKIGDHCAYSDGPESVTAIDTAGRKVWTHTLNRPASATGAAAEVASFGEASFVLVHRNYGAELQRIRVHNSEVTVHAEWLLPDAESRLGHAIRVGDVLVIPSANQLTCIELKSARLSTVPLSEAGQWSLYAAGHDIVAVPRGCALRPLPNCRAFVHHSLVSVIAAEASLERPPVLVIDASTGAIRHRLEPPGLVVDSRAVAGELQIATPSRWYCIK